MKDIGFMVVLVVLISAVFASAAVAANDERFKFEVGYNGLGHRTTFEYPSNQGSRFVSGTSFSGNGLHTSGSVKLSNVVSAGVRFDHNFLSNPTFFEITRKSERYEPNFWEQRGNSQRVEGFFGLQMPKVGTLETGVARHHFGRHWVYPYPPLPCVQNPPCGPNTAGEINSYNNSTSWGPVIGLTREVELGSFILGAGIWGYPRMSQNQEWSNDQSGTWRELSKTTSGIKLEVTGNYRLSERTAVKAGYQFFRMTNPDPVQIPGSWQIDTTRAEHAIIARYVITF